MFLVALTLIRTTNSCIAGIWQNITTVLSLEKVPTISIRPQSGKVSS